MRSTPSCSPTSCRERASSCSARSSERSSATVSWRKISRTAIAAEQGREADARVGDCEDRRQHARRELPGEQRQEQFARPGAQRASFLDAHVQREQHEVEPERDDERAEHHQPEDEALRSRSVRAPMWTVARQRLHDQSARERGSGERRQVVQPRPAGRRPTAESRIIAAMPQTAAGAGPSRPIASTIATSEALSCPPLISTLSHCPPGARAPAAARPGRSVAIPRRWSAAGRRHDGRCQQQQLGCPEEASCERGAGIVALSYLTADRASYLRAPGRRCTGPAADPPGYTRSAAARRPACRRARCRGLAAPRSAPGASRRSAV